METTNDLQNIIELNIVNLFNKTQNDSWTIIIFQTLIWSFRRWAIHYLMSTDMCVNLKDCVWDTHVDLVREFAPNELKDFGIIWLNPINIEHRGDIIEELNQYFMMIVDFIDKFIQTDNEDALNILACFLDDRLTELIDVWLSEKPQYRIYPKIDDSPDSFSVIRIHEIVHTIINENKEPLIYTERTVEPVVPVVPEPVVHVVHEPVVHVVPEHVVHVVPVVHEPVVHEPVVHVVPPEPVVHVVPVVPPEHVVHEPVVHVVPPEHVVPVVHEPVVHEPVVHVVPPEPVVHVVPPEPVAPVVEPLVPTPPETVREAITHRRLTRKLRQRTLPMTRKKTHSL